MAYVQNFNNLKNTEASSLPIAVTVIPKDKQYIADLAYLKLHPQTRQRLYPKHTYKLIYIGVMTLYGEGNGTSPQYSCLENPTDGGAW